MSTLGPKTSVFEVSILRSALVTLHANLANATLETETRNLDLVPSQSIY